MNVIQRLAIVLIALFICQSPLAATSPSSFTTNFIDTIPQIEPEYKGNRILVKSIEIVKRKGKSYKIEYKLVNNGKNKIKLGKLSEIPSDLIIQFDQSLAENDLVGSKESIIESIKKQKISIRPGQLILGNKVKFTYQPIPPSDRIAVKNETLNEEVVENKNEGVMENQQIEIDQHETAPKKFDKAFKEIVEEVPLPKSKLESPRTPTNATNDLETILTEEKSLDETILINQNNSTEKLAIEETESILEVTPQEKVGQDVEKVNDVVETENEAAVQTIEAAEETSDEKLCADLIIESAEILKKNKRFVFVNCTIKNVGNVPISLHGDSKKENDNVAIQTHFTRSHNLTRGSIPVDISFVKKGNKDIKGMLVPGETINQKLKIETSKVTKFTPVLALTLNPTSAISECTRLNNIFFIDIEERAPEPKILTPEKTEATQQIEKVTSLEN